jgi:hypothetical protein
MPVDSIGDQNHVTRETTTQARLTITKLTVTDTGWVITNWGAKGIRLPKLH